MKEELSNIESNCGKTKQSKKDEIFRELKKQGMIQRELEQAKKNDFCEYRREEKYKEILTIWNHIKELDKGITKNARDIDNIYELNDCTSLIEKVGNALVIEYIQASDIHQYISGSLKEKVENLRENYEAQMKYKSNIEKTHENIVALWELYKGDYEFYKRALYGGQV